MGFLRNALKTGFALKAFNMVRRQASDPANQRKAREMFRKARNRGGRQRSR